MGRVPAPRIPATAVEAEELPLRGHFLHGDDVPCVLVVCIGAGKVRKHLYCIKNKALLSYSGMKKRCARCKRIDHLGEELAVLEQIANHMSQHQKKRGHQPLPRWQAMVLLADEIKRDGLRSKYTGERLRSEEISTYDSLSPDRSNDFDPRGYYGGFEFCEVTLNTAASYRDARQLVEIQELREESVAFLRAQGCAEV